MLKQLMLLLFAINLSRLQQHENNCQGIYNVLVELIPFMKDIKYAMNFQEGNLTSFNHSMAQLSGSLEEYERRTAVEQAELHTSLLSKLEDLETKLFETQNELTQLQSTTQEMQSELNLLQSTTERLERNLSLQLDHIRSDITCEESTGGESENTLYTCGGTGGWRRVVYLDTTDPNSICPFGWIPSGYSKRTCGSATRFGSYFCSSAYFPVSGGEYTSVCGRIKAYQVGFCYAFPWWQFIIDEEYVDGVSLTHGHPRQHIWTFVAGYSEDRPTYSEVCPCDSNNNVTVPSFVGEDYFCESAVNVGYPRYKIYTDDPLWDGENCGSNSTCCTFNSPPYFVKQLPAPTVDDIEARICHHSDDIFEGDIAVEQVELYVR